MNAAPLAPGASFAGDFEIVRLLSTGGMGSVYVARQKSTGKERALKLMLLQLVDDPGLRRRFEQEARIASLIKSDHVVEVVGAGVDDASGVPWLAMELLNGTDLDTAITQRGAMTVVEARRVLEQLCHAVAAAHSAGIIHRDLKPENVFLAQTKHAKEGQMVKVLDFGIAKIAVEANTKHTGAMGSPMWMAPEQTERSQVTPAADVWSLGLIAFFLLTGKPFWIGANREDTSVQQILREVVLEPIPRASARAKELGVGDKLPDWFDAWFERCVVRTPSARLRNAHEVFTSFARYCDDPHAPPPPSDGVILSAPVVVAAAASGSLPVPSSPSSPASSRTLGAAKTIQLVPAPETQSRAGASWKVPVFGVLLLVAVGVIVMKLRPWDSPPPTPQPTPTPGPVESDLDLPPEIMNGDGAKWFLRVRPRCNAVEVDAMLHHDPPPKDRYGVGFAAACVVLAGRVDGARRRINALPENEHAQAVWPVFAVVHPIADQGNDEAAAPAMRLVIEFWPDNYQALYHAGIAEYRLGEVDPARTHLKRFVELDPNQDGFKAAAKKILVEMEHPPSAADCEKPILIDPEGQKVFRAGCKKR
jgi:serine/threonine protein kinase